MMKISPMRGVISWGLLMVATAVMWWLGEQAGPAQAGWVLILFAMALGKGLLVVFDFMELRHAHRRWQWAMGAWLVVVIGLILLAYWLGLRSPV